MIVAVCADPFTATFNRQGCEEGIGNEVALDISGCAEARKDVPMAWTRIDERTVGLIAELFGKRHGLCHRAGGMKDLGMGHNTKKPAQNQVGQAIRVIGVDEFFKPATIGCVVR